MIEYYTILGGFRGLTYNSAGCQSCLYWDAAVVVAEGSECFNLKRYFTITIAIICSCRLSWVVCWVANNNILEKITMPATGINWRLPRKSQAFRSSWSGDKINGSTYIVNNTFIFILCDLLESIILFELCIIIPGIPRQLSRSAVIMYPWRQSQTKDPFVLEHSCSQLVILGSHSLISVNSTGIIKIEEMHNDLVIGIIHLTSTSVRCTTDCFVSDITLTREWAIEINTYLFTLSHTQTTFINVYWMTLQHPLNSSILIALYIPCINLRDRLCFEYVKTHFGIPKCVFTYSKHSLSNKWIGVC